MKVDCGRFGEIYEQTHYAVGAELEALQAECGVMGHDMEAVEFQRVEGTYPIRQCQACGWKEKQ